MFDIIIIFIFIIVFALQYIFIWMMNQLKKRGYSYPILSSTHNSGVISDFRQRITYDKELKSKYKKLLNTIKIILAGIFIIIIIFKFLININ